MVAIGHAVAQIRESMRDAVELTLRLANHPPGLVELGRGGGRLARARDRIELRLVALFELAELIEPAPYVTLPSLFRVHCLTSLIERDRGPLLLLHDRVQPRHQCR